MHEHRERSFLGGEPASFSGAELEVTRFVNGLGGVIEVGRLGGLGTERYSSGVGGCRSGHAQACALGEAVLKLRLDLYGRRF